jgi:hypothetical protein
MTTRTYSVWYDKQEQWDPEDIDEPALRCQARYPVEAAERLAEDDDSDCMDFIVRDDESNSYRIITLVRGWSVKCDSATSLAELSAP